MSPLDPHTARTAARFDRLAATYDQEALRFHAFCADRLVALLAPAAGEKILDAAAGTGAVTLAVAQAVGPTGRVVAIDASEGMLGRLEQKLRHFRLDRVDIHAMDAGAPEFRSSYFHHTVCGFGLEYLPDMAGALREWVRVTRPGGRVMFSCFGPGALQPAAELLLNRLAGCGITPPAQGAWRASGRLKDADACRALLAAAGLVDVEVRTERIGYHLPAQAWWDVVEHVSLGELIERLPPEERARVRAAHLEEVVRLAGPDGLWLDAQTHFAGGRKP